MTDRRKLEEIRAQLPVVSRTGYFNAGTDGPLPCVAHQALLAEATEELESGRLFPGRWPALKAKTQATRELVASVLGADADEVAFTRSTTEGMNIALLGLDWSPNDEVVTTSLEHPGVLVPLCLLAHRFGVRIRTAEIGDGGGDVGGALAAEMTPRTRAIALSHVMWSSGAVMPLSEISELARQRGALVFVDGAQSAGQVPVDVHATGVDAYAVSGQKWLCGPEGTGALYVRRASMPLIRPTYARHARIDATGYLLPPPSAQRYEIGEFYGPSLAALGASLRWLRDDVGLEWLLSRVAALGQRCSAGLAAIPGVAVGTPANRMAGIVCFTVEGVAAPGLVTHLYDRCFTLRYVERGPGFEATRVSAGFWNTEEEIDRLIASVAEIAAAAK